jgi:hypothetical protein
MRSSLFRIKTTTANEVNFKLPRSGNKALRSSENRPDNYRDQTFAQRTSNANVVSIKREAQRNIKK